MTLTQFPAPGGRFLRHSGDTFSFELRVDGAPAGGRAVLRTSLGGAKRKRRETVASFDEDRPALALDWNDVPMEEIKAPGTAGVRRFAVRLPLVDIGSFHAKACFFPEGSDRPFWPEGGDVLVKVAPAWTVCWSSIYCAFPRQFGANCALERSAPLPEGAAALDAAGWSAIPREGTLRDLVARLDTILLDELAPLPLRAAEGGAQDGAAAGGGRALDAELEDDVIAAVAQQRGGRGGRLDQMHGPAF